MKAIKQIIKSILIIALTVMIIGIAAIKIISSTILDEAYVYRKMRSSNYYNNIYEELKQNFENYIGPSGLDESILDNICTVEDIQKDTETILGNIYEGTNKTVDTNEIKERLKKNITNSLNDTKVTAQTQKNIDEFIEQISNEYIITISHTDYEEQIYNRYQQIKRIINLAQIGIGIAIVSIIVLLILLNLKEILVTIKNVGIAFTASGAFLIVGHFLLNNNIKVLHLRVLNNSISMVLQNIITDIFVGISNVGIVLGVIGILLIILGNILKKNR